MTSGPTATVSLPASVPSTFQSQAQWATPVLPGSTVKVDQAGVAALLPGSSATTLRVTVLNAGTGKPLWTSAEFDRSPNGPPSLHWTARLGHPVVVVVSADKTVTTVSSYDLYGAGANRPPLATTKFTGDTKPPSVTVTHTGVLVSGAKEGAAVAWRATTGESTVYGTGPTRGKDAGTPVAAYNDGFLVTFPSGGFAFASAAGGWDSATAGIAPEGADATKGTVLAQTRGLILAAWPTRAGATLLAVHSQQTGKVLATQALVGTLPEVRPGLVVANDSSWAVWGDYVFGLRGQPSHRVDLNAGKPTLIYQEVIYASEATARVAMPMPPTSSATGSPSTGSPSTGPQATSAATPTNTATPSTSASATPSAGSTSSATPASPPTTTDKPFNGMLAVDAVTGTPVGGDFALVPAGISAMSQGVFVSTTGSASTVFSVAVR